MENKKNRIFPLSKENGKTFSPAVFLNFFLRFFAAAAPIIFCKDYLFSYYSPYAVVVVAGFSLQKPRNGKFCFFSVFNLHKIKSMKKEKSEKN